MLHMLIRRLDLRDLKHVFDADRRKDFVTRLRGALFKAGRLLEEVGARWRFSDKRERTVGLHGDQSRCGYTLLYMGSSSVELFAEIHGLHPTSPKSRPHRRRRSSLPGCYEDPL